jgi:hypothetical protein
MLETLAVVAVVSTALLIMGTRLYKSIRQASAPPVGAQGQCGGCSGCECTSSSTGGEDSGSCPTV